VSETFEEAICKIKISEYDLCSDDLYAVYDYQEKKLQAEREKSQQLARDKGDMRIEIQDLKRKIEATLFYQGLLLDAQEKMEKKLAEAVEALRFYAEGNTHYNAKYEWGEAYSPTAGQETLVSGNRARQALEKLEEKENM
jgi:hypothetical protein